MNTIEYLESVTGSVVKLESRINNLEDVTVKAFSYLVSNNDKFTINITTLNEHIQQINEDIKQINLSLNDLRTSVNNCESSNNIQHQIVKVQKSNRPSKFNLTLYRIFHYFKIRNRKRKLLLDIKHRKDLEKEIELKKIEDEKMKLLAIEQQKHEEELIRIEEEKLKVKREAKAEAERKLNEERERKIKENIEKLQHKKDNNQINNILNGILK